MPKVSYEERVRYLMQFLGVSRGAAIFIYHRKRRGKPFHHPGDPKYLHWSTELQNALVKADKCIGWDWEHLQFGREIDALEEQGIYLDEQTKQADVQKLGKIEDEVDSEGFTKVVNKKKERYMRRKALQKMGFAHRGMQL